MNETIQSVFINGREWFDRSGGNSYHSAQIWINGQWVGNAGMTYGYGSAYLETANAWLRANGILASGQSLRDLQVGGVAVYSVLATVGKRELFHAATVDERLARFALANA